MRAVDVRKLRPEAWGTFISFEENLYKVCTLCNVIKGFLCPVHTPDGSPCGLLNHLTAFCKIVCTTSQFSKNLLNLLSECGLLSLDEHRLIVADGDENFYRVLVDSVWLGWVSGERVENMVRALRAAKISQVYDMSPFAEIVFVPRPSKKTIRSLYPGLYVFTGPARLVRPVRNLLLNSEEYVGTMEQVYLGICVRAKEAVPGVRMKNLPILNRN